MGGVVVQMGGLIGDLAAAGVIDFKAVASHIASAGEPPAAGASSQGLMIHRYFTCAILQASPHALRLPDYLGGMSLMAAADARALV